MSYSSSNRILKIYKSRKTIIEIMDLLKYNTTDYIDFSINEIDAMNTSSQLDMLMEHTNDNKKVYIKYYLSAKQIRPNNLDEIIDDLYSIENVLTNNDTLIIIVDDEPNETIIKKLEYLYDNNGVFIVIHNINRLQFNILDHILVPKMDILSNSEIEELIKKYNLKSIKQLPEISRFDPQALAMCLRPGQVCCINRDSATTLTYKYYRYCI